jgi:hypothetical protein
LEQLGNHILQQSILKYLQGITILIKIFVRAGFERRLVKQQIDWVCVSETFLYVLLSIEQKWNNSLF